MMRKRIFCWIPTHVYTVRFWRDGFLWLKHGWLDNDGCVYRTQQVLEIDLDDVYFSDETFIGTKDKP